MVVLLCLCSFLKADMFIQRLLKNMCAQGTVLEKDPDLAKQSAALGAALPLNHLPSVTSLALPSPSSLLFPWTPSVYIHSLLLLLTFCRLLDSSLGLKPFTGMCLMIGIKYNV